MYCKTLHHCIVQTGLHCCSWNRAVKIDCQTLGYLNKLVGPHAMPFFGIDTTQCNPSYWKAL